MINQQNDSKHLQKDIPNPININDLILQEKIGHGGFGKVYRVKCRKNNQIYAAKISLKAIDDTTQKLFQDISIEVNIISKIDHPSILKFILYSPVNFKRKPKPVIITEYASNGSLRKLIEHDKANPSSHLLTATHKLKIIYGVASAMLYLHEHGIIHRDLKPDNVLLDDFLLPKVADFGLSKSDNSNVQNANLIKTSAGSTKGTPFYMSPEIWEKGDYSKASDVYAFAFIVYELMTLEKPFQTDNIFSIIYQITNRKRPEFNVFVPNAYKSLIVRCWSQEASRRPTFEQIMTELATNQEYITETVDKDEYFDYISFIKDYHTLFDECRYVIPTSSAKVYHAQILKDEKLICDINKLSNNNGAHFSFSHMKGLSEESLMLAREAEAGNVDKMYLVGRSLIEGRMDFPIDVKNGLTFVKKCVKARNKEAAFYYVEMLTKGDVIPANHEKALKIINKRFVEDEGARLLLYGKVLKKEKKYIEAAELFVQSMSLGNVDSIYECAKLVRKGRIRLDGIKCCFEPEEKKQIANQLKLSKLQRKEDLMIDRLRLACRSRIELEDEEKFSEVMKKLEQFIQGDSAHLHGDLSRKTHFGLEDEEEFLECLKKSIPISKDDSMYNSSKLARQNRIESQKKEVFPSFLNKKLNREIKQEAVRLYMKAILRGHLGAMYKLGVQLFENGLKKEGIVMIKRAADKGHLKSIHSYAIFSEKKIEYKESESMKYFRRAADEGFCESMN